jgi:hypothetical protein
MTTLRTRWEKPDYTGVIAEVPLWHVPHPEISQTDALFLRFLIFIPVPAEGAVSFSAEGGAAFQLQLVQSLIIDSRDVRRFRCASHPVFFLGSLLPGIWNVPDWETCIFF